MCNVALKYHLCGLAGASRTRTICAHALELTRLEVLWSSQCDVLSNAQRDALVEMRRRCVAFTEIWRAAYLYEECEACLAEFDRLGAAEVARIRFDCVRLDLQRNFTR
jgi:hypothetical protein